VRRQRLRSIALSYLPWLIDPKSKKKKQQQMEIQKEEFDGLICFD